MTCIGERNRLAGLPENPRTKARFARLCRCGHRYDWHSGTGWSRCLSDDGCSCDRFTLPEPSDG